MSFYDVWKVLPTFGRMWIYLRFDKDHTLSNCALKCAVTHRDTVKLRFLKDHAGVFAYFCETTDIVVFQEHSGMSADWRATFVIQEQLHSRHIFHNVPVRDNAAHEYWSTADTPHKEALWRQSFRASTLPWNMSLTKYECDKMSLIIVVTLENIR